MTQVVEDNTTIKKILDDSTHWSPYVFSIGDGALFLPSESHRHIWEEHAQLYGHHCVVVRRQRGVYTTGIDDEYDCMFNINGTATLVPEVPQVWLRRLTQA